MNDEETKINQLKQKLLNLGPMLPGSLSKQWNVCGKEGCKCKDKKAPTKHGPYYQLSFNIKGKSSTIFVKEKDVEEIRKRIKRYQKFKQLSMDLTLAYVDLVRNQGISRR